MLLEIFAGEGGADSKLFVEDLRRVYLRYAAQLGYETEVVAYTDSSCAIKIDGLGALATFGKEGGKHCVQRVPPTESKGRRHTSMIAVAVMSFPQEVDNRLDLREVSMEETNGGGKGGQHSNRHYTAIRVVHKPTGLRVFINGRDQYQNKQLALQILSQRVADLRTQEHQDKISQERNAQLAGGGRSDKIRTYNFISGTVTDHRTGKQTRRLKEVMRGHLEELL